MIRQREDFASGNQKALETTLYWFQGLFSLYRNWDFDRKGRSEKIGAFIFKKLRCFSLKGYDRVSVTSREKTEEIKINRKDFLLREKETIQ